MKTKKPYAKRPGKLNDLNYGQPPECAAELRRYVRAVDDLKKAETARSRIEVDIAVERIKLQRAERELERRREQEDAERDQISSLLADGVPNGGYDQPGVPLGIGAAFRAGQFFRDEWRAMEPYAIGERIRQLQERSMQAAREVDHAKAQIRAIARRLDQIGCRYNDHYTR